MLPLGYIFKKHNIPFHCFANDIQICLPIKTKNKDSMQPLLKCCSLCTASITLESKASAAVCCTVYQCAFSIKEGFLCGHPSIYTRTIEWCLVFDNTCSFTCLSCVLVTFRMRCLVSHHLMKVSISSWYTEGPMSLWRRFKITVSANFII